MQRRRRPLIRSLGALAVSLIALLGGAPGAGAQSDPGSDALMASLLGAEDLPAGFGSAGPIEGSDFDIDSAAFAAQGGRRVVSQVWQDELANTVFDFRMELPSAQAAADYLTAAAPTLSEAAAMGLAPVMFEEPVGEDGRHYAGVFEIDETGAITFHNYLFHVGPIAAKVFVATLDMPPEEARRLAERAAERMADVATAAGPDVSETAGPTDRPPGDGASTSGGAPVAEAWTLAAVASALGFDGGAPQTESLPAADDPAAELLGLVPEAMRDACASFSSGTPGEVAALACFVGDAQVVYARMGDGGALRSAFDLIAADMPSSGQRASCAEGQYVGTYPGGGAPPRGLVACWQPPGADLVVFWTDDANVVLGGILSATTDHAKLDALWKDALLEPGS